MLILKQSTASQSVLLGPFVDDTDGATAETGLTIANTDIRLSKNGGNMAAKNSGGGTHDENGYYTITLDATDTNTVGRLQVSCKVSGALAVFMECQVLEEAIHDALFAASANGFDSSGEVTPIAALGLTYLMASNLPTNWATDVDPGSVLGEMAGATFATGTDSLEALRNRGDSAWITATGFMPSSENGSSFTAIPWNASWDAEVQSECTDALNAYDPPTKAELDSGFAALNDPTAASIADAVWDELTSAHTTAGTYGKAVGDGVTAWVTATGFSTHSAADVWTSGTRTLTAFGFTVDTNLVQISGSNVVETSSGRIVGNFNTFFDNGDAASSQTQDDVGGGGGSGLSLSDAISNGQTAGTVGKALENSLDYLDAAISSISTSAAPQLLKTTTIATLTDQKNFTLTSAITDDDAVIGATVIFVDQTDGNQKAVGIIKKYTGSTGTVVMLEAPKFTIATGDTVNIISNPLGRFGLALAHRMRLGER